MCPLKTIKKCAAVRYVDGLLLLASHPRSVPLLALQLRITSTDVKCCSSAFEIFATVIFIIMVGVGEDQGILTLKHLKRHFRSISQTTTGITTEPSHRFTGAHHSVMLRLFWLGLTSPLNTSKTAYKRLFLWSSQGFTPIYSRSAFYDYSYRCLLCSDTPVTDLINFALASLHLPPTKRRKSTTWAY